MKKYKLRPLIAAVVAACALLSIGVSSASAWTDPDDETIVATKSSGGHVISETYQYQAWIQPSQWSNPRGGDYDETWFMNYAYALNGSAGNASVCVVVHLDSMDGTSVGLTCGTNGASTGSMAPWLYDEKWVFAYNNSTSARTLKGGWVECVGINSANC